MQLIRKLHGRFVHARRIRVLGQRLAPHIPVDSVVVDIGAGDGALSAELLARRPDLRLRAFDVMVRHGSRVHIEPFDGHRLPLQDESCDVVLLVDVLHHSEDLSGLLSESKRIARRRILVKDHNLNGLFAATTLRLMDWTGNRPHGVRLPYNYWHRDRWHECFQDLGLSLEYWDECLRLYPWPARLVFERSLHFIAVLSCHAHLDPSPEASWTTR